MAKLKIDESSKESIKTAHHEGSSIKDLAVKHNVSVSTISAIVRKPKEVTSNQSEDLLDKALAAVEFFNSLSQRAREHFKALIKD